MAARGEFLALGSALDRVLPKVRRDILERLLPALLAQPAAARPLLAQVMAGAYATGVQTGWVVHGSLLGGVPSTLTGQTAREWRDRAYEHGEFIANRFGNLLQAEPTVAQLRQHAAVAGESSVWKGQDEIAEEVAALVEAEYKVWVRAWPRKEQRDWHDALEGVTIPEDHKFTLPGGPNAGAQVYGPRDWEAVPKPGEHLNCGHALRYQRGATAEDLEQTRKGVGVVYTPPTQSAIYTQPAAVAAPQVTPGTVTDVLDVQLTSSDSAAAAKEALSLIDSVHSVDSLPKLPVVKPAPGTTHMGGYLRNPDGTPENIQLRPGTMTPRLTIAHEVGHFIDHAAFGQGHNFGSEMNTAFDEWRTAVHASSAYNDLKGVEQARGYMFLGRKQKVSQEHIEYLMSDKELWARSYAQFIAVETGDATMLSELVAARGLAEPGYQWSDADFEPVRDSIRNLLRSRGWLK